MYTPKLQEYKNTVVENYLRMRETGQQDWLSKPTRARIRLKFIELIGNGLEKRDEATLHNFLGMPPEQKDFPLAIKKTSAEDFKTLEEFLKKTERNTHEKNVEILAWLCNYPFRPFAEYKNLGQSAVTEIIRHDPAETPPNENLKTGPVDELVEKHSAIVVAKLSRWPFIAGVSLLIAILVYFLLPVHDDCMYWKGDRYVAASCKTPRLNTPLIAIDAVRLKGFKRISHVDTLSGYSVGRLWYAWVADSVEVYTSGGTHPLYPDKQLKKITDFVINRCRNHHYKNQLRDSVKTAVR